jgi:SAM-dependent methyltransferase
MIAAMEAMRQLVEPSRHITSFTLRDISLKRALIVPDTTEGVEISLGLSPVDESSLWASSTWKKFHISSYQPSTELWVEHATGYISAEHDQATGPVDNGREVLEEDHAWGELLQRFTSECDAPLDIGEIYENLKTVGLQFGPLFRNLGNAMHNVQKDGNVIATITVPDVAGAMPAKFTHSHLIHPATMDSMLHLFIASVACNGEGFSAPVVPTFIEEVFVSTDIISEPGHEFIGIGRSQYFAQNSHNADVTVWDMPSRKRCVSMKGLKSQPLDSIGEDTTASKQLCHEVKLTPYDQLLDATAFKDTLRPDPDEDAKYKNRIFEVEIAAILKTIDALTELQQNPPLRLKGHQQNYWDWMHHLKELLEAGQLQWLSFADWQQYQGDQDAKQALFRKVKETGVEGELAMRMGDNIVKWLRDEQDPLDLMFGQDDILTRFYSDGFGSGDLSALQSAYLGIIKDNKTNLSILEVGGGTGGTTGTILDALSNSQNGLVTDSHIQKYVFTDISPSFFEKAQERFKQYRDIMEYKTLDADRDALEQGFLPETFDMIVAYNVLHVTSDLRNTLANMRKLLKPGGKIFLQEAIRQDMGTLNISFGQLEGWWYGKEPFRKWSPYVDAQQWDKILKSTGYSGVDLELPDQRDSSVHITSVMIGTAIQPASMAPSLDEEIIIVTPSLSLDPTESITACAIQSYLKPRPSRIALMRSISNYDLHQSRCIVLDINHPILSQCDEDSYLNVRHLLSTSKSVLWVTSDATANPHNGSILGLIRTVRWERELDDTNLTTLSICDAQISVDQQAKWIAKLFDSEFTSLDNFGSKNGEYSLRGGIMFTNRLVAGSSANEYLSARLNQQNSRMIELQAIQQPIKLASPTPGLLENMKWLVDSDHDQPLAENQVEIENKAVGLNFRDLMIAMGEYKSDSWGIEGAGKFTRSRFRWVISLTVKFSRCGVTRWLKCLDRQAW